MGPKKQAKKEVIEEPVVQQPPPIPPHELQGYGKFQYANDAVYEGQWHLFNGIKMKHGKGVLTVFGKGTQQLGEQKYDGNWSMDKMEGYGIYNYADGSVYKGNWKQNKHFGRGDYQFANGTIYEGQWQGHLMDGTGFYVDQNGRKWQGQFQNGKFESKLQKQLVKQKKLKIVKDTIKVQIQHLMNTMIEQLTKSDKKSLKDNMGGYFGTDSFKEYAKEPYSKLEQRPQEKWIELLNIAKNGNIKVLGNQNESDVLGSEKILKKQLQGNGQIVQVIGSKDERAVKMVFVNIDKNWLLVMSQDDQKKK